MSGQERILRIAAKGDGVTASGRHIRGAAPGDTVMDDGDIERGPHHVAAPCRHFERCGGCQLQHCDEETLRAFVTDRVTNAAASQDLIAEELRETHLSPPRSRRRATLHGIRSGGGFALGFRQAGSHRIVDVKECHVLRPELFALIAPLRRALAASAGRAPVDVSLTLADQGVDVSIAGVTLDGLEATEAMLDFARDYRLARLALDQGYGPESLWEPEPVTVTLSGVAVGLPIDAFLQATQDGEDVLVQDAKAYSEEASSLADLFSGLGTFAFALSNGAKVTAVEAARDAHLACRTAAHAASLPVTALHGDLFRAPLQPEELARFDTVLLDPPRAGARDQVEQLAKSNVARVIYISCNPSSWARDARTLADAGFRLRQLRPVGQFRWSTHVELTSLFER